MESSATSRQAIERCIPVLRIASPHDMVYLARQMLSERCDFVLLDGMRGSHLENLFSSKSGVRPGPVGTGSGILLLETALNNQRAFRSVPSSLMRVFLPHLI